LNRPALSNEDIEWVARVIYTIGIPGYEPAFQPYQFDGNDGWCVVDAEFDRLPNLSHLTEAEANACAAALNRLAKHWP